MKSVNELLELFMRQARRERVSQGPRAVRVTDSLASERAQTTDGSHDTARPAEVGDHD